MTPSPDWTIEERLRAAARVIGRAFNGETPLPDIQPGETEYQARMRDAMDAVALLTTFSTEELEANREPMQAMIGPEEGEGEIDWRIE